MSKILNVRNNSIPPGVQGPGACWFSSRVPLIFPVPPPVGPHDPILSRRRRLPASDIADARSSEPVALIAARDDVLPLPCPRSKGPPSALETHPQTDRYGGYRTATTDFDYAHA